jgi:hypothetical protein
VCEDLCFLYRQDKIINFFEAATKVTTKEVETGGKRMEKQPDVCGYAIIAESLNCVMLSNDLGYVLSSVV